MSYVSKREAARMSGVSVQVIRRMIRHGELTVHHFDGDRWPKILVDDLPGIAARRRLPTTKVPPKQIGQRCAEVRAKRLQQSPHEIQRQKILRLFRRYPQMTAVMIAKDAGQCKNTCLDRLTELEAMGLVDCIKQSPKVFVLAGTDVDSLGIETADAILSRFREHSQRCVRRRRNCVAA